VHQHLVIGEIRSECCYGFNVSGNEFYFIDDSKTVIKLVRLDESRMLSEDSLYKMKDKDKPHFQKNSNYESILVCDQNIIWGGICFYISNINS